ncbi:MULTISPECIES: hypothetical protein [Photorhabdus]|nr:hypothetical protein [Photorhabdus aegyptia]
MAKPDVPHQTLGKIGLIIPRTLTIEVNIASLVITPVTPLESMIMS